MRRCLRAAALALAVVLVAGLSAPAHAQFNPNDVDPGDLDDLTRALQFVGESYADNYVQPISDAFGAGMNAGLFRTADVSGGLLPGVDVYLGVSVSGALMASSDKRFTPPTDEVTAGGQTFRVSVDGADDVPTAFGSTDTPDGTLVVETANGTVVTRTELPPGLVDTPVAPLVIPQLGVGSLFGTDVQLRYLPETRIYQYGTVGLFGVAVRHSISQYLPLSPVDIAIQGAWNQMSLKNRNALTSGGETVAGDVLDAAGWAINAQISKSLPVLPVTFYGGLQYENFDVEYSYIFDPTATGGLPDVTEPIVLDLDQTASNRVRGLAGVSLTLAVVRVNVDYALSANDSVTFGLGVRL